MLISSVNVNGLIRNLEELKLLLDEKGIHILAINETKLDNNIGNEIISVEGFTLRRNDRNKHGGGVAMYIKEGIKYIVRGDLPINNLEPICIEVQPLRSKPFSIASWYRPPNAPIDSFLQLERVLAYIDREGKETILLGDTNCDFIERPDPPSYVKNLKNLYQFYGYSQIIKEATRVTPTTSTLIDHVAVTNKHNIIKPGVITTAFSDHYVVYCSRKFRGAFTKDHKLILCRKLKNFDQQNFLRDVSNMPWDIIVRSCGTLDENIDNFIEVLLIFIERHAPLQQRRVSQKYCPWLTSDFHKLRKSRDKLKKAAIKSKSNYIMASYRHLRSKVNSLNKRLKKDYYSSKIQENVGSLKQTWKIVHEIVNKTSKTTKIDSIKVNDNVITNKKIIPNIMNTYFSRVGENLKAKIPHEPNPLTTGIYSINNNLKLFNFLEITEEDVVNASSTIKTSHGSGEDGISSYFIKTAITILARPLSYLFNFSLLNGNFPDSWKVARIAPIFKEGPTDDPSNYRPISVLPVLSRLFEKIVYSQLCNYLNENQFIYRHQSGF